MDVEYFVKPYDDKSGKKVVEQVDVYDDSDRLNREVLHSSELAEVTEESYGKHKVQVLNECIASDENRVLFYVGHGDYWKKKIGKDPSFFCGGYMVGKKDKVKQPENTEFYVLEYAIDKGEQKLLGFELKYLDNECSNDIGNYGNSKAGVDKLKLGEILTGLNEGDHYFNCKYDTSNNPLVIYNNALAEAEEAGAEEAGGRAGEGRAGGDGSKAGDPLR